MPDEALEHRLRGRIAELDRDGLKRSLRAPSGIDLSSNDYLGLSSHPLLKRRMADAVMREGCGSTGSRLLRGERDCFANIERRFAAFKGVESSLYFSSGYMANLAVLTAFPEEGDVIFSDARNHASLIDGTRLSRARRVIFSHNNAGELDRVMRAESGQKFVVTESLFSMDGDMAPLDELASVCRSNGAALIVDDAHAVGIYGSHGEGLARDCFVSINPAGKALGVSGAFVAGPQWAIEYLIQRARPFIFSTAAPPAIASALEASLDVIEADPERRERLKFLCAHLRARLNEAGVSALPGSSQILSVILGSNEAAVGAAARLQREGFDVRAIRPPTVPPGTARLRISVNVKLPESILDRFVSTLSAVLKESASCCAASS